MIPGWTQIAVHTAMMRLKLINTEEEKRREGAED
jgi:hypothetical protein